MWCDWAFFCVTRWVLALNLSLPTSLHAFLLTATALLYYTLAPLCAPLHPRYVDCMPTEEILPMPQEQIASILDVCLNTSKLRAFEDGSRRPLLIEVQKEYVNL